MLLTKRSKRQHAEECSGMNSGRGNGWGISNRFVQRNFWKEKNHKNVERGKKIAKT